MIKTKAYLHSTKEDMYYKGTELGLTGKALESFMYALYEVELELEIEENTGKYRIVAIDGQPIVQKK